MALAAYQHADFADIRHHRYLGPPCAATWRPRRVEMGLVLTVALGALFTVFQAYEYQHAAFGFSGHIYGATFFMATGFHGLRDCRHGIFAGVPVARAGRSLHPQSHFGFEAAAWYWHFVDVVWLFLFVVIYILVRTGRGRSLNKNFGHAAPLRFLLPW